MKMILDFLTPELFKNPEGGNSYHWKANLFYVMVFILSIIMLIKAIISMVNLLKNKSDFFPY